ncbi:Agamous-like MADS-box protein AGL80 [Linum grandiflorum]
MTRKKVKLAYIKNDSARKATYNKRKKGLIKKVSELSTLCDVQACAIIYSPYHTQSEIWPPTFAGVHEVLSRFRDVPYLDQSRKKVNQEKFLKEQIGKAEEQLRKQKSNTKEKMVNNTIFNCLAGRISLTNLDPDNLDDITKAVDQQIQAVEERLVEISRRGATAGAGGSSAAAPGAVAATNGVNLEMTPVTSGGSTDGGGVVVAPGRAEYNENINNLERQLLYMDLVNNNSAAALARTVPMATEQQIAPGYMGGQMMMSGAATASGSGGRWEFGEGSSSHWIENNGAFGSSPNSNGFWASPNYFYQ